MNKRDAREIVLQGTLTYGDLKTILKSGAKDKYRRSTVNPGFSLADTHEIFVKAIADAPDETVVDPNKNHHILMATNIIRDFGVAALFAERLSRANP